MGLARQSATTLAWQCAALAAQLATFSVVARLLGPADRGTLEALGFMPSVLVAAASLSLPQVLLSRYARSPGAAAGTAMALAAGLGALALAVGLAMLLWAPATFYPGLPRGLEAIALLQAPLQVAGLTAVAVLQAARAVVPYNASVHGPRFLVLAAVGAMLAVGVFGLRALVVALVGVAAVATAAAAAWARRGTREPWRWDAAAARAMVAGALKLHLGVLALFWARRCSVAVLQVEASRSELGYFSLASTLADILSYPALAVETMLVPRLVELPEEEARALAERASRTLVALTALGGAAAWAMAPLLVRLFGGPAFEPAAPVFAALIPGTVLYVFARMLGALWIRDGRFGFPSAAALAAAAVSMALNVLWIPRTAAWGAAWGTGIAYGVCGILFVAAYRIVYRRPLTAAILPRRSDWDAWRSLWAPAPPKSNAGTSRTSGP